MDKLESYTNKLMGDEKIQAVVLFGSYAKGTQKPDSDIDLLIITNENKKVVENIDGQIFETVYTTEDDTLEFYDLNKDDAVLFWDYAKVLFDKTNVTQRLRKYVQKIKTQGKEKLSEKNLEQLKFEINDFLKVVRRDYHDDPIKVSFLLNQGYVHLLNTYFGVNGIWTPAPKEIIGAVKEIDKKLYELVVLFYSDRNMLEKIDVFQNTARYIFGN